MYKETYETEKVSQAIILSIYKLRSTPPLSLFRMVVSCTWKIISTVSTKFTFISSKLPFKQEKPLWCGSIKEVFKTIWLNPVKTKGLGQRKKKKRANDALWIMPILFQIHHLTTFLIRLWFKAIASFFFPPFFPVFTKMSVFFKIEFSLEKIGSLLT